MFIKLCNRRGQNTAEYAILIGVIVAAAIAMQVYVRRGMQARVKDSVDWTKTADLQSGTGATIFNQTLGQYEPYYQCAAYDTSQSSTSGEQLLEGGGVGRNVTDEQTHRTGNQEYTNYAAANT